MPGREDIGLRERTLWRMLDETAARSAGVLALDVEDLDLPGRRQASRKGGAVDVIVWQTGTVRLLPRLLKGRESGPVFVTVRKTRVELPAANLDPAGGVLAQLREQAAALFSKASGGATRGTLMWLRSPTRRSAPSSRSMRSGGGEGLRAGCADDQLIP